MSTRIAEYFAEENLDWSESIQDLYDEIDIINERLSEVIRRNSISGIADKVEVYQNELDRVSDNIEAIEAEIGIQEVAIKQGDDYIEDRMVDPSIERRQESLRERMKDAEKEYIEVKFACYQFLSDLLA